MHSILFQLGLTIMLAVVPVRIYFSLICTYVVINLLIVYPRVLLRLTTCCSSGQYLIFRMDRIWMLDVRRPHCFYDNTHRLDSSLH